MSNDTNAEQVGFSIHDDFLLDHVVWTEDERRVISGFMSASENHFWHFFKFQAGNHVMYTCETAIGGKAFQAFSMHELLAKVARFNVDRSLVEKEMERKYNGFYKQLPLF